MLEDATQNLAERFAVLYDAEPVAPSTVVAGRALVFSFHGGLSRADQKMLEAGREDSVRRFRERFMHAISVELVALIESATGARVSAFFAGFDPESRATIAVFVVVAG